MKRILIVDDEIDLCSMISLFLAKKNYEVHTANTLKEGIDKVADLLPDSLLLDNNLPDGMGWSLAENVHRQYPHMNITLISASTGSKELKDKLGNSVNILEKPLSLRDIEHCL